MRRSTVGGYQGPVAVLTPEGVEVARAACRYHAEEDSRGQDRWSGRLHRIDPPGAVAAGAYRLRLPDGQEGDVTVQGDAAAHVRDIIFFEGSGSRPRL